MPTTRDRFVHFQNIDNYRRHLRSTLLTDRQRTMVMRLLAEETKLGDEAGWLQSLD